ncbi:MAG: TetR/AcrR family transcriptional regulator [Bacteroidia bacterium]|nr:MAG: TetR/AcrR family transcriptional regulator [Bacteroidia bacterium]
MARSRNTEKKIFDAATELFLEKGVDRTSVREIANKAEINLALMNYYFRSKENLFDTIFSSLVKKNSEELIRILNSDLELFEKIEQYVEVYIEMLSENPLLVSFVMAILHRSRERITEMKAISSLYATDQFTKQLLDEAKKGNIRRTDPTHFFVDMLSLIAFPFAIKMLVMDKNNFSEAEFQEFIDERKKRVPKLLLDSLRPCK